LLLVLALNNKELFLLYHIFPGLFWRTISVSLFNAPQ
jgi:hypothetical protein